MEVQTIDVKIHFVKKYRGKSEWHTRPAASALGETVISHRAPIILLITKLVEEGKIQLTDNVDVYLEDGSRSFNTQAVQQWIDGSAVGRKPGSRSWLHQNKDGDDE